MVSGPYVAAADSLVKSIPHVIRAYRVGLRHARSPLGTQLGAWAKCRHQAESILTDCVAGLRGEPQSHPREVLRYSRLVGVERVEQGIAVADSIHAVEILWTAAEEYLVVAASCEVEAKRAQALLVATAVFHSSANRRLYAGAIGYDAARHVPGNLEPSSPEPSRTGLGLSRRETEVLAGVERALSNVQIAHQLGIAPATVKRHLHNIYGKLGASSRVDALNKLHLSA